MNREKRSTPSGKFNNDIAIDEQNLTEELIRQPQLFYEWAKEAVNASVDSAVAKDKLEVIRSEVELRIRKHPSVHGLPDKPTEAQVKAAVIINRKVKSATRNYFDSLRVEKILAKAERAFEHRKKSLEGLVSTNQQLYFANPKTNTRTEQRVAEKTLLQQARKKRQIKRRKYERDY